MSLGTGVLEPYVRAGCQPGETGTQQRRADGVLEPAGQAGRCLPGQADEQESCHGAR